MKTIKTYIFITLFACSFGNLLAQNDIYNNSPKKEITAEAQVKAIDSDTAINYYYTEADYKLIQKQNNQVYEAQNNNDDVEDKNQEDNKKEKKCCRGNEVTEFAFEVAVDVFINMAAILIHFWD